MNLMNPWYGENTMEKVLLIIAFYILIVSIFDFICVCGNLFSARISYILFIYESLPGICLLFFIILRWIISLPLIIFFSKITYDALKRDFKVIEQNEARGIVGYNRWTAEKQRKKWEHETEDYKQKCVMDSQNVPKMQLNFKLLFLITFSAPIVLLIICYSFGLYYRFAF